jgi:hypothetical protein
VGNVKHERCEAYWTAYFARLDETAPHSEGTAAAQFAGLRDVKCWHCKDGVLFTFKAAEDVTFAHSTTMHTVERTLYTLTAITGGAMLKQYLGPTFPDAHDFFFLAAEVGPGESAVMQPVLNRVAWFRGVLQAELTPAGGRASADVDHAEDMELNVGAALATKPTTAH